MRIQAVTTERKVRCSSLEEKSKKLAPLPEVAAILLLVRRMMNTSTTFTHLLSGCAFGCALVMGLPSLGGAASSPPYQVLASCKDGTTHLEGDAQGGACTSQQTLRTENGLQDFSHTEKRRTFPLRSLDPQERDLRLWYYPGAPRPLWGY